MLSEIRIRDRLTGYGKRVALGTLAFFALKTSNTGIMGPSGTFTFGRISAFRSKERR